LRQHILDTVVDVLRADTTGTKRFSWAEISFFQRWWDVQTADVQVRARPRAC
jgi:hypothetical protein